MATATSPSREIPRTVVRKLNNMRNRLTRWILVHGISRWLIALLGILAFDMLLDRMFRMDFAQRLVMMVVMVVAGLAYFGWKVLKPLWSRPNDEALIYEVEHKNPDLNESLISSVQLARQTDLNSMGVSQALTDATIHRGFERAQGIDFGGALDLSQYFKNWMLLLSGLVGFGLLGWGVTQTDFLRTWYNRNILLLDDQWPQATYLEIVGAVDGKMILPRGTDHRQVVNVTENSTETDVTVSLEVDNPGGRTIHQMKPTGKLNGREHVFMFHNVSSPFRFRASGGDDVTEWVNVELVEPPNIIELSMQAKLPEYTGVASVELTGNGPYAVLVGSRLQIDIKTNKSLSEAGLKLGDEVFPMESTGDDKQFGIMLPPDGGVLSGGDYEFELVDASGLKSTRSSKFKVTIREDEPPKVRASLLGISGLVSTRANLPTSYQVVDEYGLTQLAFDCNWKTGIDSEPPGDQVIVFEEPKLADGLPIRQLSSVGELDLLPLNLLPGTSFRFSVAASDNHPDPAGIGRSQEFLLRVVSDDELRADLLRREIEQRKAFDQAYQIQMEKTNDLEALMARTMEPGGSQEDFLAQQEAQLIDLVRSQKGIGTSVDRVAERFLEFLVEFKNNRLDEAENAIAPDQRIEIRFDQRIIQPIKRLDQELITLATRNLDNCRRLVRDPNELTAAVSQTIEIQMQIQEEMKRILSAMNDSESFQEIINDLLEVKQDAAGIRTDIENKLNPSDIFDEKKKNEIFDK